MLSVQNPGAHLRAIRAAYHGLLTGKKKVTVTLTFDEHHLETLRADYRDIEHNIVELALQAEIQRLKARLASKRRSNIKRRKAA